VFSTQIFQENTFLKTKPNFSLTEKCFPLTNFSNGKQTQESLENGFPETTFQKTNTAKRKNTFLETKPNFSLTEKYFSLTEKCFSLTNFSNNKQTRESLESDFQKINFRKQTWLKKLYNFLASSSFTKSSATSIQQHKRSKTLSAR